MSRMPDVIGMELNEGLEVLKEAGLAYRLVELKIHKKEDLIETSVSCPKRIVRQLCLDSSSGEVGQIEILYSIDTYQLGN